MSPLSSICQRSPSRSALLALISLLALLAVAPPELRASELVIDAAERVIKGQRHVVRVQVAWANTWHDERNHDGVWIVLRAAGAPRRAPLRLAASGHSLIESEGTDKSEVTPHFEVSEDRLGVFVSAAEPFRGDLNWRLELALDEIADDESTQPEPASTESASPHTAVEAWGLEMVYVPAGPFELGDDAPLALSFGAFSRLGADGLPAGPYALRSEDALRIAPEPGALYYDVGEVPAYRGDQRGPVPAAFPKGTRAFLVMKYELTQGQYAAWLNALPAAWAERRVLRAEEAERLDEVESWSILARAEGFVATAPARPCNFVSWDDTSAILDWMALRPMTELEYTKAARGPIRPVPLDHPWGAGGIAELKRVVLPTRDLAHADVAAERELNDTTRAVHGASYYGVMDLSGSMWERVISVGHPRGRSFEGTHGDGLLEPETGDATNADWPSSSIDGREANGIGYRGGAEYFGPRLEENPTNPNSPVALRTFAAWNGAYRYKTYSARGVRSLREPAPARRQLGIQICPAITAAAAAAPAVVPKASLRAREGEHQLLATLNRDACRRGDQAPALSRELGGSRAGGPKIPAAIGALELVLDRRGRRRREGHAHNGQAQHADEDARFLVHDGLHAEGRTRSLAD